MRVDREELQRRLSEKGLVPFDLISCVAESLTTEHVMLGVSMGKNLVASSDPTYNIDVQANGGIPPRTLLERLLIRFQSQYAMDSHNLNNYKEKGLEIPAYLPKQVGCLEIWMWLLRQMITESERRGAEAGIAIDEREAGGK